MIVTKEEVIKNYTKMLSSCIKTQFQKDIFIKNASGFRVSADVELSKLDEINCIERITVC